MSDSQSSLQQDLPRVRLYDCYFPYNVSRIEFKLSGLMSLIRCEFKHHSIVNMIFEKSQDESEVTEETLRNFTSRDDQNRIEIIQTKIDVRGLHVSINNAARRLKMENVDFNSELGIYFGKEWHDCETVSVFELEMIYCRVFAFIWLDLRFPNSFAKLSFENTVFEQIALSSKQQAGLGSYVFDNCTFTEAPGVEIQRFLNFKILRSVVFMPNDCDRRNCDVHLTGVDGINLMSDIELSEIFFNRTDAHFISHVDIESSSFQGGQGPFFTVRMAGLKFSKTVFHIQSHRTRPDHLIDFDLSDQSRHAVRLRDVLINITSINRDVQQVNIMFIVREFMSIYNTRIMCPLGMDAVETLPLDGTEPRVYHCQAACTSDMYTFQYGNMTIDGNNGDNYVSLFQAVYDPTKSFVSYRNNPHCNQCPVGAKCNRNIKALPDYWGYKEKDTVVMIRCPTGYCCQDDESCQSFDSCNSNRSGPLCGVCEKGLAESLFDQTCIPLEKCHTWLIVLLYISCAVGYGFGLMVIDNVKGAVISSLKKIYQCIKGRVLKKVKPNQNLEKSKNSENPKCPEKEVKEEGSFKYLQILFYYVQDAALFKIELPGKQPEQTSTFVKILQFTPDVLTNIYDSMIETCFTLGTTAVSKILFKSIFGPCVMLFLFIVYLCQSCVFSVRRQKSKLSSLIK